MDVSPANLSDLWALNGPEAAARSSFYAMGHSVRTDKWRYTECKSLCRRGLLLVVVFMAWLALAARAGVHWNVAADGPDWSQPLLGRELYDHQSLGLSNADFDSFENENLVEDPTLATITAELQASLRHFFQVAECRKTLCSKEEVELARRAQGLA